MLSTYCYPILEVWSVILLTWIPWLLKVAYFSCRLSNRVTWSFLTMLLLSHWTLAEYSSSYLLKDIDGVLELCILDAREWPLTSSKLLQLLLKKSLTESTTISILLVGVIFWCWNTKSWSKKRFIPNISNRCYYARWWLKRKKGSWINKV